MQSADARSALVIAEAVDDHCRMQLPAMSL
jgi:hypothetical protein